MGFYEVSIGSRSYRIQIERAKAALEAEVDKSGDEGSNEILLHVHLDGHEILVNCRRAGKNSLSLIVGGRSYEAVAQKAGEMLRIVLGGRTYECSVRDPRSFRNRRGSGSADVGPQKLAASMPGKIVRVLARAGDEITTGQGILVIEAMKMQNEVRSPRAGVLKQLAVQEGTNVNAGQILAIIE